jgi:hypothetical protein
MPFNIFARYAERRSARCSVVRKSDSGPVDTVGVPNVLRDEMANKRRSLASWAFSTLAY